jgi:hypothetical protein
MELMHGECPVARSKANRRGGHLCPGVQQDRATQEVITEAEGMAKGAVREICSEMADLPKLIKSDRAAEVGGTDKATVRRACCEMADLPRRNKSECPAAAHGVNQGFQETADLPKLAEFERAAALAYTGAPARVRGAGPMPCSGNLPERCIRAPQEGEPVADCRKLSRAAHPRASRERPTGSGDSPEPVGAPARVRRAMDGGCHSGAILATGRTVGGRGQSRVAQDEEVRR